MFIEGSLLYFDPFYFKSGNTAKPKYFLVLKVTANQTILASLPSSQDYVPSYQPIAHGCIELAEANFSCYVFIANQPVLTDGWAFPKNTFLYGQQIDEYPIETLADIYPVEGVDYQIIGQLTTDEFIRVKRCFTQSATVKRKYKRILAEGLGG
ncbi:hypothetical protein EXU85_19770 [Spirosoma sp. KCTC 42546]|nr:hypothetical protein EXU85_19770 [Spirosoma sp. KCTC 42546]